jgi:hypothetical protein
MIKVTMNTDNAAFDGDNANSASFEVGRILRRLGKQIQEGYFPGRINANTIALLDNNGQTVGEVRFTGKDRDLA